MAREGPQVERPPIQRVASGLAVADLLSDPCPATHRPYSTSSGSDVHVRDIDHDAASPSRSSPKDEGPETPIRGSLSHSYHPPTPSEAASEGLAYQYASVQQIVEGRENIEYILNIREQPKHSRMCGVGEKADRRPIDPAPIVQLRVITHPNPVKDSPPSKHKVVRELQSSGSSELSSMGNLHSDALPQLRRGEPVTTQLGEGWEDKAWYLENPYYFMCAMLADADKDEELHLLSDGKTRYTTGSCVSCLYHLKDIDGSHQGFFVFPDLSIRVEGRYRLKLCLFETIGNEVHHCKSIYSSPFMVYTAKRFPGMEESTMLSRSFADQGLKVRVRKNPRGRRARAGKARPMDDIHSDDNDEIPRSMSGESFSKRLRSDSWLSAGSNPESGGPSLPPGVYTSGYDSRLAYRPGSPSSPPMAWSSSGPHRPRSPIGGATAPPPLPPPSGHPPRYLSHQGASHEVDGMRRGSFPLVDERMMRSRVPQLPPISAREAAWPPVTQMPPPMGGSPAHTSYHSQQSIPQYTTAPGRPSPTAASQSRPVSPELAFAPGFRDSAGAGGSRQRSVSSAAWLAPHPWESRGPHGASGTPLQRGSAFHPGSAGPSPSPSGSRPASPPYSSHGNHARGSWGLASSGPPRPRLSGPHGHGGSGRPHVGHLRERSFSDPRKVFRPPGSSLGSVAAATMPAGYAHSRFPPPISSPSLSSPPRVPSAGPSVAPSLQASPRVDHAWHHAQQPPSAYAGGGHGSEPDPHGPAGHRLSPPPDYSRGSGYQASPRGQHGRVSSGGHSGATPRSIPTSPAPPGFHHPDAQRPHLQQGGAAAGPPPPQHGAPNAGMHPSPSREVRDERGEDQRFHPQRLNHPQQQAQPRHGMERERERGHNWEGDWERPEGRESERERYRGERRP